MKFAFIQKFVPVAFISLVTVACAMSQVADDTRPSSERVPGWKTNTEKRSIELNELMSGGPPKDGIRAIDFT